MACFPKRERFHTFLEVSIHIKVTEADIAALVWRINCKQISIYTHFLDPFLPYTLVRHADITRLFAKDYGNYTISTLTRTLSKSNKTLSKPHETFSKPSRTLSTPNRTLSKLDTFLFDLESVQFEMESVLFGVESVRLGLENVRCGLESVLFGLENVLIKVEMVYRGWSLLIFAIATRPQTFSDSPLTHPAAPLYVPLSRFAASLSAR